LQQKVDKRKKEADTAANAKKRLDQELEELRDQLQSKEKDIALAR